MVYFSKVLHSQFCTKCRDFCMRISVKSSYTRRGGCFPLSFCVERNYLNVIILYTIVKDFDMVLGRHPLERNVPGLPTIT